MLLGLPLKVCLLLAVVQALCWLLARGLGVRLERRAMALGLILPLVLLAPFLFRDNVLLAPTGVLAGVLPAAPPAVVRSTHIIQSDTFYELLPWELEVRHALRAGRLPLWSDVIDGGSSPWINPLLGVLSPLAMLSRVLPIQYFLLVVLVLKLLVACEGAWLLARQAGISRAASGLAAAGFTLGGGMLSWGLYPHTTVLCWVPWLAVGCVRLFRRPRPLTVATTAVVTAILLLSAHPETAAAGGLFVAACGIGLRRRRTGLPRGLAAAGAAALLGFALAAPVILPFVRALPQAQRTRDMLALHLPDHDARLLSPRSWFVPASAKFVLAPTNPRVYGIPYQEPFKGPEDWVDALSGYTGLVAFAGATVALVGWRRRQARRALPFLGFAVAALLVAGDFVPFALLVERVPALRLPAYTRLLPVCSLAVAVAGGFGVDLLLRRLTAAARRRALAALAVAAVVSLVGDRSAWVVLCWALLAAGALLAPRRRGMAVAVLALALALDLGPWAERLLPRGQPELFLPANPLTRVLARETAPTGAGAPWRAVGIDLLVYPSLLPAYGIAEIRTNQVMVPSSYLQVLEYAGGFAPTLLNYYAAFRHPDHPMMSFLGVRAAVGNLYLPRPRTLVPLDEPELLPFIVYRNPRALPRWFVPAAIEPIERAAFTGWLARMDDAGRVAVYRDQLPALAGVPLGGAAPTPAAGAGAGASRPAAAVTPARALASGPGWARLAVPGAGVRLLATSLAGPYGWRAQAADTAGAGNGGSGGDSGRPLAEITVDGAFLGVVVPPGVQRVDLAYRPPGLLAGTALGGLALAVTLGLALVSRAGDRRGLRGRWSRRGRPPGGGGRPGPQPAGLPAA